MRKLREQEYLIRGLNNMCSNIKNISKMAEIGSYIGESTEIFAQNFSNSIIHCVDPWQSGYDQLDLASLDMDNVEFEFDFSVKPFQSQAIKQLSTPEVPFHLRNFDQFF